MSDIGEKVAIARERIQAAIREYEPEAVFALFSGGHDSLTATYIASLVTLPAPITGVVHINTGIGVEQTRAFVRTTCQNRGWRLLEYKAIENVQADGTPDPQDYRAIVREFGFPGPSGHNVMYARLKQRQIQRLCRDFKRTHFGKIMLIAGCRSEESVRRIRNTKPVSTENCRVWVNPIHDFTKFDCNAVIAEAGLDRSPVVDLIHKSGECLCGAFAQRGELAELALWFPGVAAEIRALEAEVKSKFGWGWEDAPPEWFQEKKAGQTFLLDYDLPDAWDLPLCHNCLIKGPETPFDTQPKSA